MSQFARMALKSAAVHGASGLLGLDSVSGQAEVDRLRSELASTEAAKQRLQAARAMALAALACFGLSEAFGEADEAAEAEAGAEASVTLSARVSEAENQSCRQRGCFARPAWR